MSAEKGDIERLKAMRAAQREVVSKLEKEMQKLLSEDSAPNRSSLEVTSCLLETKLKVLNEIDDKIISSCALEEITDEIERSREIVARIIETR